MVARSVARGVYETHFVGLPLVPKLLLVPKLQLGNPMG